MTFWDQRYAGREFVYGKGPNDFLVENVQKIPMGEILCLCAGEGRNAVWLAEQGFTVTAVDSSSVGLEKAQRLAAERGVQIETMVADLASFEIQPHRWQGITSFYCHVPPPLRFKMHQQVRAGLAAGGVYILEAYTPRQLDFKTGGPPVAELMMTEKDLKRELFGLTFEILHEIDRKVQEGTSHSGMSAVIQCLARNG